MVDVQTSQCGIVACTILNYTHQDYVMSTIEARGGKIIIEISGFKSWQAVKMVLCPVPDVTKHIVKTHGGGRVHVDRLWG